MWRCSGRVCLCLFPVPAMPISEGVVQPPNPERGGGADIEGPTDRDEGCTGGPRGSRVYSTVQYSTVQVQCSTVSTNEGQLTWITYQGRILALRAAFKTYCLSFQTTPLDKPLRNPVVSCCSLPLPGPNEHAAGTMYEGVWLSTPL